MSGPRYIIKCDFANVQAEVLVNDIPVVFFTTSDASPITIPVNQYLVSGVNSMAVRLHARAEPARSSEPWSERAGASYRGPGSFRATIARYEVGEVVARTTPAALATLTWEAEVEPIPQTITADFRLGSVAGGPWAWETADRLGAMREDLRREVLEYLARLHRLLVAGMDSAFVDEVGVKLRELERAYSDAEGTMQAGLLEQLAEHGKAPWVLAALEPSTIDVRVVAGGRLVECQRNDRGYVLEYRDEANGDSFFLPLVVGRRGGTWSVLR